MEWANWMGLIGIFGCHKFFLGGDFLNVCRHFDDHLDNSLCKTYNTDSLIHHVWKEIFRRPSGRRLSFQVSRLSYFF